MSNGPGNCKGSNKVSTDENFVKTVIFQQYVFMKNCILNTTSF